MRTKITALLAVLALTLGSGLASAADTIRVASEGYYPPFNYFDESGKLVGFDIDIARALCERMGAECEIVAKDWDGLIPGLVDREYDAIIASMSITEERMKRVAFSDPYYSNALMFVGKSKRGLRIEESSLKDKTAGAQQETISAQYLEGHYAGVLKFNMLETQDAAWAALTAGQIDLVLSDMYAGYDWLQTQAGKGHEFIGDPIDIEDKIGIAVRKEDDALRDRFNKALGDILLDGTYVKINAKYFPFNIY